MITRSWFCLNKHCKREFTVATEGEAHPPCVYCGGLHVRWVPKPVAIKSAATQKVDKTVADTLKYMSNNTFNSPRMGERMAPRVNPTPGGNTHRFAPAAGWAADVPVDNSGTPMTSCGTVDVSKIALPPARKPDPGFRHKLGDPKGRIEAAHRPPRGGT